MALDTVFAVTVDSGEGELMSVLSNASVFIVS